MKIYKVLMNNHRLDPEIIYYNICKGDAPLRVRKERLGN